MSTNNPVFPILIVDDEEDIRESYKSVLCFNGINNFILCPDSRKVMDILGEQKVSILLLDLNMPYMTGHEVLEQVHSEYPEIPVIIITGSESIDSVVECMKHGAYDYLVKPIDETRFVTSVKHAINISELQKEVHTLNKSILSQSVKNPDAFSEIVTHNPKMKQIFKYIEAIANSPRPVMITGESGVGKELIARVIHNLSNVQGDFISLNISGLDDTMFSDTLFGHKKGAFTGATENRKGLIEQAAGGTIFLDEIGDLEHSSQIKLLRLLQEREYYMLGSDLLKTTDARVIVATNVDLKLGQAAGKFRKDLYYRLVTHNIHIPPLKERYEDIPLLFDHFVEKASKVLNKPIPEIPEELYAIITEYNYPGNVRELEAVVFNAISVNEGPKLSGKYIEHYIKEHTTSETKIQKTEEDIVRIITASGKLPKLKDVESYLISEALKQANGNKTAAAHIIGISPATMTRRFKEKN